MHRYMSRHARRSRARGHLFTPRHHANTSTGTHPHSAQAGAATIRVCDRVPNVKVKVVEAAGDGAAVRDADTADLLRGKSAVLFGVPAAFSPSCSDRHLPSYLEHMEALKSKGIDLVLCMAVNDAFVMKAWAAQSKGLGKITFVADGNGVVSVSHPT